MTDKSLKQYPLLLALIPVVALLCIAVTNYIVDPYRIFSSDKHALYKNYPALHPNLRLHKAYQVNLQKPDTIILGSSKAIQGIPLDHEYFDGKSMYNLAAPLASMRELYHLLMHAQANQPLNEVVFVIDFLSFNVLARTDGHASGYVESRLKKPDQSHRYWQDYLAATISADAFKASYKVMNPASNPLHRVLNGQGGREDDEIAGRLTDDGHRSNSQKLESFFIDAVLLAAPHRRYALEDDNENSLEWFEKFVQEVIKRDIPTKLVIGPSHTRYWELLHQAGLWTQYEKWKEQLVNINQRVALNLNKQPLPIWDFTLPNSITTEAFPAAGDSNTRMQYYYESVHFNQHTGALVLDRISGNNTTTLPENFGVLLNKATLPSISQELRAGLKQLRTDSPETVGELLSALPRQRGPTQPISAPPIINAERLEQ